MVLFCGSAKGKLVDIDLRTHKMITNRGHIIQFCLLALLSSCGAQRAEQLLAQNPCSSKITCSDCIRTASCAWCYQAGFQEPRCFNPAMEGGTGGCDEAYIFNPDNQRSIDPMFNRELSRAQGHMSMNSSYEESMSSSSGSFGASGAAGAAGSAGDLVQVKPQRVKLSLRMNQMQKLEVAYSQAQDYPVDLYYLMDLSRSMKNDKEKLSTLGKLLSTTMRKITSNFKLGFGSFVDKLVMPYVSTVPKNLLSPCEGCAAPYGFKNQMSLSTDTDYFDEAVRKADVSGNLDAPEGGFDAIMQAMVCKNEIGWRDQVRRLLVFSTDAGFHYAGDGKLGGIIQPNDGECHMEENRYTHSTIQDYPSISQINLKARENSINVIFAVTKEQISVYEELSKHIEGSSSGVLSEDSSNVVDLVRDQYSKISSAVEMKDNSSSAVQILYYSSCLGDKSNVTQTNKCDGLKVGDVVQFTAEITLKECPKDRREWKQVFQIHPVGISESMIVELDMLCDCPCEHQGHHAYVDSPTVCSGQGVSACGVCLCHAGRFGKSCECSAQGGGAAIEQERGCRPLNSTTGPLCSNRGTCFCGQCECTKLEDPTKVISGPYCECDNFTCDMNKGLMCSGPEHGMCVCGKCECTDEYTGPACQCLKSQEPCRSPENGKICHGNGQCVCGKCVCNVNDESKFYGTFCEKCPACTGKCKEFKECVLCEVHKRGEMYNADAPIGLQCGNCTLNPLIEEGKIAANESRGEYYCSFYDQEDCLFAYVYSYSYQEALNVRAQKDRECPPKVFILGIVLGVIAAIVLVGLALLMLWKMVTTIHDRREFARFEKERMMAKWDTGENPIYKQATSTFKNPTYAGK